MLPELLEEMQAHSEHFQFAILLNNKYNEALEEKHFVKHASNGLLNVIYKYWLRII